MDVHWKFDVFWVLMNVIVCKLCVGEEEVSPYELKEVFNYLFFYPFTVFFCCVFFCAASKFAP